MAVRTGKRNFSWGSEKHSTLIFTKALDGGDPGNEYLFRDEVFEMDASFNGNERSLLKTITRMGSIQWANNSIAIASDYWFNTRNTKTYVFNPSDASVAPRIVSDRNYQDVYSNPGSFVTQRNEF